MFTIRQMMVATPAHILHNAQHVTVVEKTRMDKGAFTAFLFHVTDTDGPRSVELRIYDRNYAWVHCDCPWFTYDCEYALTLRQSSSIIDSNCTPCTTTNPAMKPQICKHVVGCFVYLQRRHVI